MLLWRSWCPQAKSGSQGSHVNASVDKEAMQSVQIAGNNVYASSFLQLSRISMAQWALKAYSSLS